jgi:RDD family
MASTLFGIWILPAIVFALVYSPIVTKLARGLLSPYAKADVRRRLFAASIDGLIVVMSGLLYWTSDFVWYLAAGAAYLLFRDAIRGQSVGKLLLGLVVIGLESGRPCSLAGSARRNLLFLLPGANVVAIFLEARTVVRDLQGQRLGDRLAQTQVVEGLGAKDLVKLFRDWLMGLVAEFDRDLGGRGRAPERIDRAA